VTVVIFDVDGVFLSEERCFDVSALSVHELLFNPKYLNLTQEKFDINLKDDAISKIRDEVFIDDQVLTYFKKIGLNSNWDMLFITFSIVYINLLKDAKINAGTIPLENLYSAGEMLGHVEADYTKVMDFLNAENHTKDTIFKALEKYAIEKLGITDTYAFKLYGPIWQLGQHVYQEWYLGSDALRDHAQFPVEEGKTGYLSDEVWIEVPSRIKEMLTELVEHGCTIGIATGRSRNETLVPFKAADVLEHFEDRRISTASEVQEAEQYNEGESTLSKPHPYSYLWSLYEHDKEKFKYAVNGENISEEKDIYVVGDSIADFYCSDKMGVNFIATLTGLTGDEIISDFEALGVERRNMIDTVLDVPKIVLKQ
jgi:phosphoglycolate phosphatase-like HAD superfamily hydrolase